ncbi:aldose epimerase family protein [Ruegeria lacuscaerulensis]|uniref:aldose epimerase family protein n=1 Tax=Ruegeria lacuscaerulensis TaxID=55218 RepID=UPI00147BCBCB|nr:aldose epimerase family protein [Ruegeria lacuscaerulensis]
MIPHEANKRAVVQISNGTLTATLGSIGASLIDLRLDGIDHPLVLGWKAPSEYLRNDPYLGCIVGRCANRISNGQYALNGKTYSVERNFLGKHCLHGGSKGAARQNWRRTNQTENAVSFELEIPEGDMGFGGALSVKAHYSITSPATLNLDIRAIATGDTICNFTPHWYFNLNGDGDIGDHLLRVRAQDYLPVDDELIPLGSVEPVRNTPYDFQTLRPVGDAPLDHNFCIARDRIRLKYIAQLHGLRSGVALDLHSTEPGLQIYSGDFLDSADLPTVFGAPYSTRSGLALEPQGWPDAINNPSFPSVVFMDGQEYHHQSQYMFSRLSDRHS